MTDGCVHFLYNSSWKFHQLATGQLLSGQLVWYGKGRRYGPWWPALLSNNPARQRINSGNLRGKWSRQPPYPTEVPSLPLFSHGPLGKYTNESEVIFSVPDRGDIVDYGMDFVVPARKRLDYILQSGTKNLASVVLILIGNKSNKCIV